MIEKQAARQTLILGKNIWVQYDNGKVIKNMHGRGSAYYTKVPL